MNDLIRTDLIKTANSISMRKTNMNADSSDTIYYNIVLRNENEDGGKQLIFSENRTVPVLSNPQEYDLACVRMLIPSFNIPLLFFPSDNFYVKLKYGSFEVQTDLQYIPNATSNPFASFNKLPVYDYSEITQSLNNALATAKTSLDGLVPTAAFDAPFMTYEASTQLFSLNAETAGYDESLGPGNYIEIIFSAKLFEFYTNLQDFFLNEFETRINVYDAFNNSTTFNGKPYLFMQQSQPSLELFSDLRKIVVFSNSIPIVPELQPTQDNVTRRVLFDFNVTGTADKSSISYYPQGPLRFYNMVSSYELKQIDCEIRWESQDGETYPIFINKGTTASLKLMFQKKIRLRLEQEDD